MLREEWFRRNGGVWLFGALLCAATFCGMAWAAEVANNPVPLPNDAELFQALKEVLKALPEAEGAPGPLLDAVTEYLSQCREWYGLITAARGDADSGELVETPLGTPCKPRRTRDFVLLEASPFPPAYWHIEDAHFCSALFMDWEDYEDDPGRAWGIDACAELSCLSFSLFNKWGKAEQFALVQSKEEGWEGLEFLAYPDGKPRELSYWREGKLVAAFMWNADGSHCASGRGLFPEPMARLHPEELPSAYAGDAPFETDEIASCAVYAHFDSAGPNQGSLPCLAVHVGRAGEPITVPAPEIPRYTFLGWSGDVESRRKTLTISPESHMRLVAHYGGEFEFRNEALGAALRRATGLAADAPMTHAHLGGIRELDLNGEGLTSAHELVYCRNLEVLDLSRNRFERTVLSRTGRLAGEYLWFTREFPGHAPLNRLLFVSANVPPYALRTMCLDGNAFLPYGPDYLPESLRELSMRRCNLMYSDCLQGLTRLEVLVLEENPFQGEAPLFPRAAALRDLSLRHSLFTSVEVPPDDAPERAGLCVSLEDNPLTPATLEETVPLLRERGIAIILSNEEPIEPGDGDLDWDGYSNAEERRFVSLFHADRYAIRKAYEAAIRDPAIPRHYLELMPELVKLKTIPDGMGSRPVTDSMSIDAIPTQKMDIFITEGFGELYPGDGEHCFAKYAIHDDGTWDFQEIEFRAVPKEGWQLRPPKDHEQAMGLMNGPLVKWTKSEAVWRVSMKSMPPTLSVGFVEAPSATLDLYADFEQFVADFCPSKEPLQVDLNMKDCYEWEHGYVAAPPKGDGISDGAQIRQVAALLKDPDFRQNARGGPFRYEIVESWKFNLERAERVLGEGGETMRYLPRVLAAYAFMGGYGGVKALGPLIEAKLERPVDCSGFDDHIWSHYLSAEECATNDSTFNEWAWAEVSRGREPSIEIFDLFVEKTLHPDG